MEDYYDQPEQNPLNGCRAIFFWTVGVLLSIVTLFYACE